jgi:predicted RNase H-like HicB family nuclease
MKANVKLTAVIKKGQDGWFIGYIEEIPGVLTQGKTIEETKENLMDALELFTETQREESEKELNGAEVIREEVELV